MVWGKVMANFLAKKGDKQSAQVTASQCYARMPGHIQQNLSKSVIADPRRQLYLRRDAEHVVWRAGSSRPSTDVSRKLSSRYRGGEETQRKAGICKFPQGQSDCFSTGGIQSAVVGDQFWKEPDPTPSNSGPTNSNQELWLNGVITACKVLQTREEKHTEGSMPGRDSCTTWSHSFRK